MQSPFLPPSLGGASRSDGTAREAQLYFWLKVVFFPPLRRHQPPPLHQRLLGFHTISIFLLFLRSLSYLTLYRGQIEDIIPLPLNFCHHAVILKVPFCRCVQDGSQMYFFSRLHSRNQRWGPSNNGIAFTNTTHTQATHSSSVLNTHSSWPTPPQTPASLLTTDIR